MKAKEAQSRAAAEHGELALITVDTPQVSTNERISLRPPMLQVKYISTHLSKILTASLCGGTWEVRIGQWKV